MSIWAAIGVGYTILGVSISTAFIGWLVVQGLHRTIERMEIGREFEESALTDPGVQVMVRKGER